MVAPTIELGGRTLSGTTVPGGARAAVSDVRIEWGRESVFDRPRPGVATFKVVNYGLAPDVPRKGESVLISHPSAGVLFRGSVAEAPTSEAITVKFANGLREDVTITTVTAHDALAAYAQLVPTGPSVGIPPGTSYTPGSFPEGVGGWSEAPSANRIAQIRDAGAGRYSDEWGIPTSSPATGVAAWCAWRKPSDTSALDLLHEAYSAYRPLSTFTYDPVLHRTAATHMPEASTAVVTLQAGANGALSLSVPEGTNRLPASRVRLEETVLGAPAENIAEVRIEWTQPKTTEQNSAWVTNWTEGASSRPVPGAESGSTYTSPFKSYVHELNTGLWAEIAAYRAWWLGVAAERFAALNGIRALPPLIIDPEDPALSTLGAVWLTTPKPVVSLHYLAGSMFNGEGAPSVVQFIGGTLTYNGKGEWRHALTASPTAAGAPAGLSLDEMFPTASTDRLDAWAADITINDLAAVTRKA